MTTIISLRIRTLIFQVMLVSLVLNLMGCAPAPTEAPPTARATSAIPTISPTATTVPTETPIPTPTQTPFVPKATIRIVVHVPLSGDSGIIGTDIAHAAELAVQQQAGPLNELGYKVEVVSYDDKIDIDVAVANAKEIVADPAILCGVGHFNSRIMIQASEVYHKEGLAFISPSNTNPTVTDRGYLEVNRIIGREDGHGAAGAQFAKVQGFLNVFIITQSGGFGTKNAGGFKREADLIGLKVVGNQTTDLMENFDSLIAKVISANPDLIYFASTADQEGPFINEARSAGYMGAFLGIDASPALVQLGGPFLVDGGGVYYSDYFAPVSYYPDAAKFAEDFQLQYGAAPQIFAATAFDATGICLRAMEEASKAKGGEIPTREEVANAIRALVDYRGITGTYTFDKKGDPTLVKYFIYKVVSIDPAKWDQNAVVAAIEVAPPK